MEQRREDPLERFERRQQERKANGGLKIATYVMAAAAVALAVALVCVVNNKRTIVTQLDAEKAELTQQIISLQSDYENLSSEYDMINSQLDSSREEIALLVEKVKKTQATDRAQIRKYERELGTLRTIMRSYIVQIDSLNTLNHQLTADAANARREAAATRSQNKKLSEQVEDLSGKVAEGAVIKGRGVHMEAYGENDKVTDKSNKAVRMLVTLSLIENPLAEAGPLRVYVRVTDPDGKLLDDGHGTSFNFNSSTLSATASREIDYTGRDIDLGIYINNIPSFTKGIYTVQAYTEQSMIGSAEMMLR